MFNDFLTSLLQIVVVLDVLGVVAYFVLGALKPRSRTVASTSFGDTAEVRYPFWRRALVRIRAPHLGLGAHGHVSGNRPRVRTSDSLDQALGNLKRVLYSYQEGLA